MSTHKTKEIEKMEQAAKLAVRRIFSAHGFSTSRRIGMQRVIREALITAARTGVI